MGLKIHHVVQLLLFSVKSLRNRWWPTLNAVIGIAAVVGTMATILAIATGYRASMNMNGSSENILIMSSGAQSELESNLSIETQLQVKTHDFAEKSAEGLPLSASESYSIVTFEQQGQSNNIALRGVESASYLLRPEWHLLKGRLPTQGRREVIVGQNLSQRFPDLQIGYAISIDSRDWLIVGIFGSEGSVSESEIWADRVYLQGVQGNSQAVQIIYARPKADIQLKTLETNLNESALVDVKVLLEADYYARQAKQMSTFVEVLAFGIGLLMAVAAMFAAMNSSHAAIASRRKEFATFIVLGVSQSAVLHALLIEAIVIGVLGALLGFSVAYVIYDGHTASTLFYSQNFTQVVFNFELDEGVFLFALLVAVCTSFLGGLAPALNNARSTVSSALSDRV
ncbi:ABC transporter permease [Pseudoalteromonas rubra]|uniref:ABC transporter permease n=1 Tax=Pseudoalteromonas rubra TaxID=43658 RepID=A0A0F4QUQ0_9GAMM|nr:ABC transporter permease [Pseudoalteromonas rubra]KJZ11431.1 hypothetical protein TW77_06025 [Pseudoalteromonas rubra]